MDQRHFESFNMNHGAWNKFFLASLIIICGVLFFLPVYAEETTSSTTDNTTSTTTNNEQPTTSTIDISTTTIDITTTTEINTSTLQSGGQTEQQNNTTTTIEITTSTCTDAQLCVSTTTIDINTSTEQQNNNATIEQYNNQTPVVERDALTTGQAIQPSQISDTVNKILNYFKSQQSADGKIIDGTITDWAIMSFGANSQYADEIKNATTTLLDYEKKYNLDDPSDMNSCATYPRHILALLSAGVDKNDSAIAGLKNKMETICYKDNLYGLYGINDDVFALLALLAIDENVNAPIIQAIVSTTKSWQLQSGAFSWPDWYDPTQKTAGDDITGAAVNALKYAQIKGAEINNEIFTKAKNYLKTTQQTDGGWGWGASDVMTTSWVLMGINALNETQNDWFTASGTNPWYPLVNQLKTDGFYESAWVPGTIDWFAMKHAVPALLGKSWPIILPAKVENFSEGATFTYGGGGSSYTPPIEIPTTTIATTTISTPDPISPTTTMATTTIEINTTTQQQNNTSTIQTPDSNNQIPENKIQDTRNKIQTITNYQLPITNHQNPTPNTYNLAPTTTQTLTSATTTIPYQSTAKNVFATATTLATGLGVFLAWRLLQTLV